MRILLAAIVGFVLDLILGDPELLTPIHPVVLMGHCITALEHNCESSSRRAAAENWWEGRCLR